jgi:hypothetical protein
MIEHRQMFVGGKWPRVPVGRGLINVDHFMERCRDAAGVEAIPA